MYTLSSIEEAKVHPLQAERVIEWVDAGFDRSEFVTYIKNLHCRTLVTDTLGAVVSSLSVNVLKKPNGQVDLAEISKSDSVMSFLSFVIDKLDTFEKKVEPQIDALMKHADVILDMPARGSHRTLFDTLAGKFRRSRWPPCPR